MWVAFKHSHFFSKNNSIYAIFNDQSFNDMITNDIISFEQLGPENQFRKDTPYYGSGCYQANFYGNVIL